MTQKGVWQMRRCNGKMCVFDITGKALSQMNYFYQ